MADMNPHVHMFRVVYSPVTPITPKTTWYSQSVDYDSCLVILGTIVNTQQHLGKCGLLVDSLLPAICYMEVFDPQTKTWEEFMDEDDDFVDTQKKFKELTAEFARIAAEIRKFTVG